MRRKHRAQLGQAPANCNHNGLEEPPVARGGSLSLGETQVPNRDDRDLAGRVWSHGEGLCAWCMRRVAIARRHQARRLWLLARDLCTSAALRDVGGRGLAASRTLRLAFVVLSDRAWIFEPGEPDATPEDD
jgi:hypothetical protein